jgi:DNA (cytosine-5)-methyltransferase 1
MSFRVLSLFSGMGGTDVGFSERVVVHRSSVPEEFVDEPSQTPGFVSLKRLPFETVFQNDILPEAKHIAEINGWAKNYHLADIRQLLADGFAFPAADVVTGGFPCQDFSHAGKRKGFDSDRGTLYQAFVEVVRKVRPLVFVAENVNGLLTMPGNPIQQILADFAEVGYDVQYQLLKCEEFGIPQTRWRVIILGVRSDLRTDLPDDWATIDVPHRTCAVGQYFAHLDEPTITQDPAQRVYSKAARLEKGQGQKEIRLTEPAPTMRAEHHGNIEFRRITGGVNEHDKPERRLTVREAALIQTFPPDCVLADSKKPTGKAYKPIGNAVPPLLGYIIARKVHAILSFSKSIPRD